MLYSGDHRRCMNNRAHHSRFQHFRTVGLSIVLSWLFVNSLWADPPFTISGGLVTNYLGELGYTNSNFTVLITDPGSIWMPYNVLEIGWVQPGVQMIVTNGGRVLFTGAGPDGQVTSLASSSGSSNNSAVVTGTGSLWTNAGPLIVGYNGGANNSVSILDGGTVQSVGGTLGYSASSSGNSILINGTNSTWTNLGDLTVGLSGSANQLVITNGGYVTNGAASLGSSYGSSNNVAMVSGSGSKWDNGSALYVGRYGAGNQLRVTEGGQVSSTFGFVGTDLADNLTGVSSNSVVSVDGTNSSWNISSNLYIGFSNSITISHGGQIINHDAIVTSGNNITLDGTDSAWIVRSNLFLGTGSYVG